MVTQSYDLVQMVRMREPHELRVWRGVEEGAAGNDGAREEGGGGEDGEEEAGEVESGGEGREDGGAGVRPLPSAE